MSFLSKKDREKAIQGVTVVAKPSNLPWLVQEARADYELRTGACDSLDTKLASLVAVVTVILALPSQITFWYRLIGTSLAVVGALVALYAFSPKGFFTVGSTKLHDKHGTSDLTLLQSQTLGLLMASIASAKKLAEMKTKYLLISGTLVLLAAATVGFGAISK